MWSFFGLIEPSMIKQSAGILLHRDRGQGVEVLLVHPGGPFWARKDAGAWSIPKGEFLEGDDPFAAARREFSEELGLQAPPGEPVALGSVKQSATKVVFAWSIAGDLDVSEIKSNTFELEWPPKSGHMKVYPEVDRAGWFTLDVAQARIVKGQLLLLQKLAEILGVNLPPAATPEALDPLPKVSKPSRARNFSDGQSKENEGQTTLL